MDGFLHVRVSEAEVTEVEKEFWSERFGARSRLSVFLVIRVTFVTRHDQDKL